MKKNVMKVVLSVSAVMAGLSACAALSARNYVLDGLIFHWDGIENVAYGAAHNNAATQWTDLTGNGGNVALATFTGASFGATGLGVSHENGSGKIPNSNLVKAAVEAAEYTVDCAFNKTEATPTVSGSSGDKTLCSLLTFGGPWFCLGTYDDNKVGFNPNGESSTYGLSCTLDVPTTLGQHYLACRQSNTNWWVRFDDAVSPAGTTTPSSSIPLWQTSVGLRMNCNGYDMLYGSSCYPGLGLTGTNHAMRIYGRALSDEELLVNRAVDEMRYFGKQSSECSLPDGYRFVGSGLAADVSIECRNTVSALPAEGGTISIDGGAAGASATVWGDQIAGTNVTLVATPAAGYVFAGWSGGGIPAADSLTSPLTTVVKGDVTAVFTSSSRDPYTYTWRGAAGAEWSDASSWQDQNGGAGVPAKFDDVVIPSGKTAVLTAETPEFGSVSVAGTLAMSNWTTRLVASNVTIAANGVVKPVCAFTEESMSNRVWIVCTNLTIASGGKIDADLLGYEGMNGPGKGTNRYESAAHGGTAGRGGAATYGSLTAPEAPGSGGWTDAGTKSRCGGGAVRVEAAEDVVVNGTITAKGEQAATGQGAGGSGGSVWITCKTIEGYGSVDAGAKDWDYYMSKSAFCGGGGGGRISVCYDATAQAAKDDFCSVRFSARGGYEGYVETANTPETDYPYCYGGLGSLYFTDNRFLTSAAYTNGWKFSGVWHSGVELPNSFAFAGDTTFDDCALELTKPGLSFTFAGNVTSQGAYAPVGRLVLHEANVSVGGDLILKKGGGLHLVGGSLSVGGAMTFDDESVTHLSKGPEVRLTAGPTNTPDSAGIQLDVAGDLRLNKYATLRLECCPTNGAIPKVTAGNVYIATNAVVYAKETGWGLDLGYGKGGSNQVSGYGDIGAAHGGFGGTKTEGKNRNVYGDEKNPVWPGSSSDTERGGGVIHITTPGKLQIFGELNASAFNSYTHAHAAGSGGSIYLSCHKLLPSTGSILANGGPGGSHGSAAGGGRIAIYANSGETNGVTIAASAGTSASSSSTYDPPTDGTVYWHLSRGFMLIVK